MKKSIRKCLPFLQAFVISFTSDFIPRMVYQYMYSPDGSMHGFVNHTLSYFNTSHFEAGRETIDPLHLGFPVEVCRYSQLTGLPPNSNFVSLIC